MLIQSPITTKKSKKELPQTWVVSENHRNISHKRRNETFTPGIAKQFSGAHRPLEQQHKKEQKTEELKNSIQIESVGCFLMWSAHRKKVALLGTISGSPQL